MGTILLIVLLVLLLGGGVAIMAMASMAGPGLAAFLA